MNVSVVDFMIYMIYRKYLSRNLLLLVIYFRLYEIKKYTLFGNILLNDNFRKYNLILNLLISFFRGNSDVLK